jgi:hypothetical protein
MAQLVADLLHQVERSDRDVLFTSLAEQGPGLSAVAYMAFRRVADVQASKTVLKVPVSYNAAQAAVLVVIKRLAKVSLKKHPTVAFLLNDWARLGSLNEVRCWTDEQIKDARGAEILARSLVHLKGMSRLEDLVDLKMLERRLKQLPHLQAEGPEGESLQDEVWRLR